MGVDTEISPSLGDLTFDVEPRREWTPPNPHSPEAGRLWEGSSPLRTVASTSSVTISRSVIASKPSVRPATDTRVYDIRKAQPSATLEPIHKQLPPVASTSLVPDKQPTPSRSPSPSLRGAPIPATETRAHAPEPSAAPESAADCANTSNPDLGRSTHMGTRRGKDSPRRIVYPEPSFDQLSFSELPSVRGQTVTVLSPPGASANISSIIDVGASGFISSAVAADGSRAGGGAIGCGCSGAGFNGRRSLAAQGATMMPDASGALGYSLADHMSAMSSQMTSSCQDPVDAYLARYQMHQRIKDQFRVRQDEHFRTVQELGARIQAMSKVGASGGFSWPTNVSGAVEAAGKEVRALSPSAGSSPNRQGSPSGPQHSNCHQQQQTPLHQPQLPDHPLQPRNRFLPKSAASSAHAAAQQATTTTTTTVSNTSRHTSGGRLPGSATSISPVSNCNSPPRCPSAQLLKSGLTGDGTEYSFCPPGAGGSASGGGATAATAPAHSSSACVPSGGGPFAPHPQQGAYLALPDGSFAGSTPLRGVPTTEGLLFEKYSKKYHAADLPELQLRYIRPDTVAPREPRQLRRLPRQPAPPARALPNGIPASRLERLSARRRDRSPPHLFHQHLLHQQLSHPAELLKFTGAPITVNIPCNSSCLSLTGTFSGASGNGNGGSGAKAADLTAVGDGLLRSVSLVNPGPAAPRKSTVIGPVPSHLSRTSGIRAASAPSGNEVGFGSGAGTLAQYLAVTTATSGEPMLDENFYEVLQQHFRSSMHAQTHALRAQLNINLPLVLGALNCVNLADPQARTAGSIATDSGAKTGAGS